MTNHHEPSTLQAKIAYDSLERYSGSRVEDFCPYILLTNFPAYVTYFAKIRNLEVFEGSAFKVAHSPKEGISILDFHIGAASAALVTDLLSFLPAKGILMLGMCGGLRSKYTVGEYLVPVASVRGEGASDFYFPKEVPAMANFLIQRAVTHVLEKKKFSYHVGLTYSTNIRFWEFNEEFKSFLQKCRVQAIEMECATLFAAAYRRGLPLGALLLISDLPLDTEGIKTKESATKIFKAHTEQHVETGVAILQRLVKLQKKHAKGTFRKILEE